MVEVVGRGPVGVVAVHGWMGDHRLFAPMFDFIDRDRFTWAFPDCRGYGARREDPGPMTIAAMAADVLETADRVGWERFHVAGHSMGAMAAQRLMVDAAERLLSTVLIAPVPACGAKIDGERRRLLLRAIADAGARREAIDINTGRLRDAAWLDELLQLSLDSTDAGALAAWMDAWTGTDFAAESRGSRVPALAIAGELDPAAPAERIRETILAWYPNAELEVMRGVGHYPMREDPRALLRLLDDWLLRRHRP